MSNRLFKLAVTLGISSATAISLGMQSLGQPASIQRQMVGDLVQVLNSKDAGTIRRFVKKHLIPNAPVEQRVSRWIDLAEQGAPFKIVRDLKMTETQVDVVMFDKNGSRIALIAHFEPKPSVMLVGISLAPAFSLEGSAPDLAGWTDLESLARKIEAKSASPGIGIAVIRNGTLSIAVDGVRKVKGTDAVQPNDVWSIGSIGKPLCSTVIGRLIEQGKLRWDETLKQALPDVPMDPGYAKVTLEQIMVHRGGIPSDLGFRMAEVKKIIGSATTPLGIRDKYVRDILHRKPVLPPGTQFEYSNAGYALLSHIAERSAGKPYEQLLRDLVFKPLGLTHSYRNGDVLPRGRPSGHVDGPNGLEPRDMTGPMEYMFAGAGGGIFMSVGDLAKFGQMHLNGLKGKDGLLTAATVRRLHRGIPEGPRALRLYACGWGIETLPGLESFHGHNGSNGTMRAQLAIFPESGLVVAAIVNRDGEDEPSPGMQAVQAIGEKWANKHR